ncbi:MAG: S-layer homology domain-containing protein [Eubacteriales bacterium]|nr:S-layer homology domain-containing protein [Eubacteriales bacterium]
MKRIIAIVICIIILLPSVCAAENLQPSYWAAGEVETAISLDLVPEILQSDYTLAITRKEFAALIVRLADIWAAEKKAEPLDSLVPQLGDSEFTDTSDENVLYCSALGIVEGDGKGHFMPDEPTRRQQAAKMLYKTAESLAPSVMSEDMTNSTFYSGYAGYEMPHSFEDSSLVRSWSTTAVNWCYRHGIMQGVGNGRFSPETCFTREQAILTILRLYYCNGMSSQIATVPGPDYYPIFRDWQMNIVSKWIDSRLEVHSSDELGYISSGDDYIFVYDNIGVGVTYGHLINRAGERMLTDLYGTEGRFKGGKVSGNLIELYINLEFPHDSDAPFYFVIDMDSKEIYENKRIEDISSTLPEEENSSQCEIVSESTGWYALYSRDGRKLSKTYQNALSRINDTLFLGWVSDYPRTYDIIYCDGNMQAKLLRTEEFRYNLTVHAYGGIYVVQNTDKKIVLFDTYGDTINEIILDEPVVLAGLAKGLLVLEKQGKLTYYTPGGKALPDDLTSVSN